MNTESDVWDISSEVISNEDLTSYEVPLLVFRIIGCAVVTLLVGFTIIIYVTTNMFHVDCWAQLCCETCIFSAYMLILLTTTESFRIKIGMCLTISIFLHLLFVSAAFFLLLEAVCICQSRISSFERFVHLSVRNLLLIGWICPAAITGISAIVWYEEYTTKTNCWLNVSSSPYWPTMIPIVICTCLHVVLTLVTLIITDFPLSLSDAQYKRARCYRTTRWASFVIILMLTLSWYLGVRAYHEANEGFFAAFTIVSIILGVSILTLRISTDDEIREKITTHIIGYIVPSNKVTVFASKGSLPKRGFSQEAIFDTLKNGKPGTENGNLTAHK